MAEINPESSFEDVMQRLEEIVAALESPDLSLEEGMKLYQEGALCSRFCREKLENARHHLEIWQKDEAEPIEMTCEEFGDADDE